ncbi:hypothetical protein P691DRAFT_791689 [Macrolepiota fuliginosa MF-IS2]|uniref:Uncharacterized protein n=1 Tax=Macrolepiota fuliginosa MF-IS2 TaxID=1400762 RepID=A0A9P5WYN5_9AGAR|nr:hypothetical protein P691DRAFT_791689 [Macrolepiota fuliginosa MF-IS2]
MNPKAPQVKASPRPYGIQTKHIVRLLSYQRLIVIQSYLDITGGLLKLISQYIFAQHLMKYALPFHPTLSMVQAKVEELKESLIESIIIVNSGYMGLDEQREGTMGTGIILYLISLGNMVVWGFWDKNWVGIVMG